MSQMQGELRGTVKFYTGGLSLYPKDELYKEMAFISYYFHWSNQEVMELEHVIRRRWCEEISAINRSLNPSKDNQRKEKSIFDLKPTSTMY